jgi:hypothetical protein
MRRLLVGAVVLCGCQKAAEHTPDETVVALDQIPSAAMDAAKKKLPGVKFDTAWKTENGAFEICGKTRQGKIRDLQVTSTGEVLEVD